MSKSDKKKMEAEERKWQAEDDLRTLTRADEIRKDKPRLRRAIQAAKDAVKAAQKTEKQISGD